MPDKKVAPVNLDEGTDVATTEQAAAPATRPSAELGQASGEVGAGDIQLPTLRILQGLSENPEKLDLGTITLDNSTVVEDAKGKCRVLILTISKYYKEVLAFGAGMPRNFDTAEEAIAEGFTVARSAADRASGRPIVDDAARIVMLIEQPEGAMARSFPISINGKNYAQAIWWIQSTAYRAVAKYIFSKLAFELRKGGLLPAVWQLKADEITGKSGKYFVPNLKLLNEENSPEFIEELKREVTA